jgi:hypothetical protein
MQYYKGELERNGWSLYKEREVTGDVPAFGRKIVDFKKGEYYTTINTT